MTDGSILALTAHAREVSAPERERLVHDLPAVLPEGSILVATCHRVEAYVADAAEADAAGLHDLLPPGGRLFTGDAAVRHLVSVAVGRDSVVLGEDEILHQLRASLDAARRAGTVHRSVDRLFAVALQAGRRARSWQQGPRRSLGDAAVEAIERQQGPIAGRAILVVGAGKMGGLAARVAHRAGARVSIANRSPDRARALATTIGAAWTEFDPGPVAPDTAGVVVALGGPWPVGPETIDGLVASGVTVVDLSFPAAVAGPLVGRLGHRLVTADRLAQAEAERHQDAASPDDRLDELVDRSVAAFAAWAARGDARATADALVRRADEERALELDALWRRLPEVEPETRDAIEGMTRHLAARLLRHPLERLGRDADGRDHAAVRDLFAL